jgi:tryptophanyl-tRNA synthetase
VVYAYHKVFNPEARSDIEERCKAGTIGCVPCKKLLVDVLNRFLAPIREHRAVYERDPDTVWDILNKGTARAREEGAATMALVREAMKIDYFAR